MKQSFLFSEALSKDRLQTSGLEVTEDLLRRVWQDGVARGDADVLDFTELPSEAQAPLNTLQSPQEPKEKP